MSFDQQPWIFARNDEWRKKRQTTDQYAQFRLSIDSKSKCIVNVIVSSKEEIDY